jgi:hypothetical protein
LLLLTLLLMLLLLCAHCAPTSLTPTEQNLVNEQRINVSPVIGCNELYRTKSRYPRAFSFPWSSRKGA